jgi:hypothetical protein
LDGNIFQRYLILVALIFIAILLPISIFYVLSRPLDIIRDDETFKKRWGALYEFVDLKEKIKLTYYPMFLLRRIVFVIIVFCLVKTPIYQLIAFLSTNLFF